jgi:hypothetical protein
MAYTFEVPVVQDTARVSFPPVCICCGNPREVESTLRIIRHETIQKKRSQKQVQRTITVNVPHCARCQRQNSRNDLLSWITFFVGAILAAVVAFFLYSFAFDWLFQFLGVSGNPRLELDATTVVIILALISGVPFGLLLELLIKVIFIPIFGRSLLYAPPLVLQLVLDHDYIAGLTAVLSKDLSTMRLKIHNRQVADAFSQWRQPPA